MMKTIFKIIAIAFLCVICGCRPEIPMVGLGIDDFYVVNRMQSMLLAPEFSGKSYEWKENDSIVSCEKNYVFCRAEVGTYNLQFTIFGGENPIVHELKILVQEENVAYSPYISKVYEFRPAPGQFINEMPSYSEGDTEADIVAKVEELLVGKTSGVLSLGGYGGYVTFGFDHCVMNRIGKGDFRVLGNAMYSTSNTNSNRKGGSSEPGIVMVSMDKNLNGLPDDEFYELAGSDYHSPATLHNYIINYYRPQTLLGEIRWSDNQGRSGVIERNNFHTQTYFPQWINEYIITFSGTCLPSNCEENEGQWTLYMFDWGYVDNHPKDRKSVV